MDLRQVKRLDQIYSLDFFNELRLNKFQWPECIDQENNDWVHIWHCKSEIHFVVEGLRNRIYLTIKHAITEDLSGFIKLKKMKELGILLIIVNGSDSWSYNDEMVKQLKSILVEDPEKILSNSFLKEICITRISDNDAITVWQKK